MSRETDFASQLKELESITAWFESDEADLGEALVKFERGMELAGELKTQLKTVENRVEKIKQRFSAAADVVPSDEPELD
jgi:exodeoxyribonuclease VII small subunit